MVPRVIAACAVVFPPQKCGGLIEAGPPGRFGDASGPFPPQKCGGLIEAMPDCVSTFVGHFVSPAEMRGPH